MPQPGGGDNGTSSREPFVRALTPIERPDVGVCQPLRLIAMRRTLFVASGDLGKGMVSTPFLNAAEALSSSMSCSGIRRSKRPWYRSLKRRALSSDSVFFSPEIERTPFV